jgi:alkaline phosphatase D
MIGEVPPMRLSRRAFLAGTFALRAAVSKSGLAFPAAPPGFRQYALRSPRFQSSPFTLGVASGDPVADGVVLWTRLAPDPLNGGGMTPEPVTVNWRIAEDDGMRTVVRRGAADASPEFAHAVHVEVSGLKPDRPYWFQFNAGGAESVVGRTRTVPADNVVPGRMRFAFVSCSHFEMGYFTPLGHLANEDVSLAFHLGDYIYESPGRDGGVRRHLGAETRTLDDYRTRYAQYKTDADLQRVHAAMPFAVTWDDHEVDNDYAGIFSEEPMPMEVFLQRRAAAYQAYYEHMPLRASARPRGGAVQLYRRLQFGRLASFFVLDTRQYRSDQPCGAGPICAGSVDPATAMLGAEQERWFVNGLRRSGARWTIVPQQIMMAKVDFGPGPEERYFPDHWNGYDAARSRILAQLAALPSRNAIVLTGDLHSAWVNDLKLDYADPKSATVATELIGTSISSGGDGSDLPGNMRPVLAENPCVRFYNGQRGYVSCELTARQARADFKVVDYVTEPGAPVRTRASFVIEDGRPGAVPA